MSQLEFIKECKNLALMYGYSHYPYTIYEDTDERFIFWLQFEGKTPSLLRVERLHDKKRVPYVKIEYTSVLYNYSPKGNVSITSKDHTDIFYTEEKLDKFKWDVFEKWLKTQAGVHNLFVESLKEKKIKKRIKQMEKDFK